MENKKNIHSVINGVIKHPVTGSTDTITDTYKIIEDSLKQMYEQIIHTDPYFNYTINDHTFTVFISEPKKALKAVVYIGAYLAKSKNKIPSRSKVRMGIGLGKAKIPNKFFTKKEGLAFDYAEEVLNSMKKHELIRVKSPWPDVNEEFDVGCTFAETLMKKWTVAQAEVVLERIKGKNQTEIGRKLQISQPAVAKHLMASHWEPVEKFLIRFYKVIYQKLKNKS